MNKKQQAPGGQTEKGGGVAGEGAPAGRGVGGGKLTPSHLVPCARSWGSPLSSPLLSLPPSSAFLPLPPPPSRPRSAYLKARAGAGGRPSRAVADAPSSGSRRRRTGDLPEAQPDQGAPGESWLEREADPPPARARLGARNCPGVCWRALI